MRALELLQELDLKIDSLKRARDSQPAALKSADDALAGAKAKAAAKLKAIDEIDKIARQTQAAIDLNRDRLTRSKARLESVQNTHEFQAANKEIDQLQKLNGNLEEQLKKSASDTDLAKKELIELEAAAAQMQIGRDTQVGALTGEADKLNSELTALTAERKQYTSKVEARIIAQYDRVRQARGGLGYVPAIAGRCHGCNMLVPAQMYNEIQRGDLHACPSCHRLLFMPNAAPAENTVH